MEDVAALAGYKTMAEPKHPGIIVALWVDRKAAERITLTEDPEELHITIRYEPDADPDKFLEYVQKLRDVAASFEPLDGFTSGMGRFYGGEKDVIYAVPDVKGIDMLRAAVIEALGEDGSEHGYTPHITVSYAEPDEPHQFMAPGQLRVPAGSPKGGQWTKGGGAPGYLDPSRGVQMSAQGYLGGYPPFTGSGLSNEHLSPENAHLRQTPVDTDLIVALRAYNANIPSTYSIPDDAEVFYGGKVMSRAEMRSTIAKEMLDQPYAREKVIDIYMGPPAAGKSGAVAKHSGKDALEVDSDIIKTKIPEFNGGKNANGVHEESSAINDMVLHGALARGAKIALPIVGKSEGFVRQHINTAKEYGYTVNVHMVHAPASSIGPRMRERISNTGRFVDPKYYYDSVQDKPLDVFRRIRNDPAISRTSAWDTTTFPAKERAAATFAELEPGTDGSGRMGGRGVSGADGARAGAGEAGLEGGLARVEFRPAAGAWMTPEVYAEWLGFDFEPLEYAEKPNPARFIPVPLHFNALTIKCGEMRTELPFLGDDDAVFDMNEVMEFEELDWTEERLQRFAEWMGYTIEPNPEAASGFSVVSPSGRRLGGYIANQIVEAWQKNPDGVQVKGKGGKKAGGKKGGGGKGAAKTPEQKAAEKAAKDAEKLMGAQAKAAEAFDAIIPEELERKSKGKISAEAIKGFMDAARSKVDGAADAKAVAEAVRKMKLEIAKYKREATMPPPLDQQLADTKQKLKANLPSATRLAGTTYDEFEIDKIIQEHTKMIDTAADAEEAKTALKDMRNAIADYKLAEQKAKKDAKKAKAATALPKAAQPKTASEWAAFYMEAFSGED